MKKYIKIIEDKVILKHDARLWMRRLFVFNNYIIGTDGFTMAFFPNFDESNVKDLDPDAKKIYGNKINEYIENLNDLELNIISLKSLEEKINKIPKVGKILKEIELCEVCDGKGYVEWNFEHYTKTDGCPECYGFPELEKEIRSEEKTEIDVDKLISFNGLCYSIESVLELIQMCKDVGCSDLLYYRNYFKVGDMVLYKFSVLEPDIKEIEIEL